MLCTLLHFVRIIRIFKFNDRVKIRSLVIQIVHVAGHFLRRFILS